jgi:hypothetical protein
MPEKYSVESRSTKSSDEGNKDHARKILSSLFSGFLPEKNNPRPETANNDAKNASNNKSEDTTTNGFNVDQYIPKDPVALRKTAIFQSTYKILEWQRDNYLVGTEYAEWRKVERQKERPGPTMISEIPFDPQALGHAQITNLASWFIPSETVRAAVLPLVTPLPMTTLFPITVPATVSILQGQQQNLDPLMKSALLEYLKNPDNRLAMKNSMQGYIASMRTPDDSTTNTTDTPTT